MSLDRKEEIMNATVCSNRQNERAPKEAVQLTEQESKLVGQIDEQRSNRQVGRSKLVARLLSTPLVMV
jgi:hypothetical protein